MIYSRLSETVETKVTENSKDSRWKFNWVENKEGYSMKE